MASGFCLRVLLLPLIIYGQLASGNVYRYRSENRPHNVQTGPSSRTYSPVSSHDGVHPRAFKANFPEGSTASVGRHEPGHFFSGPVDSYSQRGSVPSYKPASFKSKPSQAQQPQSSFLQGRPRLWEPAAESGRKRPHVVSSGAIVMQAEKTPEKQSRPTSDARQAGASYTKLPSTHPVFSVPAVLQPKAGLFDSQSPGFYPQTKFVPETPVKGESDPWKTVPASKLQTPGSTHPGRLPLDHPVFSNPAVPATKINSWDGVFGSSVQSPAEVPQKSVLPQNIPGVWDKAPGSIAQSGSTHPGRLPLNHPVFSNPAVPQTKINFWDGRLGSSAQSPSFYPQASFPQVPEAPVKGQPNPWKTVPASKLQTPGSTHPGRLPLNHPVFSNPAVLQSKEGVWDRLLVPPGPRGSRPEASGSYPLRQQPRPASSMSQRYGGLVDKAAQKTSPRSSKTALVSTLFQSGQPQASTHGKRPVAS